MKKQIASILAVALVCGAGLVAPEQKNANAAGEIGVAEYVSVENAPIIDGQVDDIWLGITSWVEVNQGAGAAYGEVTILWNETGLYFLAQVNDSNVNNTDCCNFWVSETYYSDFDSEYTYPFVDGAYFLSVNSNNTIYDYKDPEVFEGESGLPENYQTATQKTESGYIVEAYVPLMGSTALEKGNAIGFDCSIDNFVTEGAEREGYRYWGGLGAYWENPSALRVLFLKDDIPQNESPSDSSSANTSVDAGESSSNGCNSSVTDPMLGCALFAFISLLKRKE